MADKEANQALLEMIDGSLRIIEGNTENISKGLNDLKAEIKTLETIIKGDGTANNMGYNAELALIKQRIGNLEASRTDMLAKVWQIASMPVGALIALGITQLYSTHK